jgi:2-methylisocitrate lyase-like PEP mutase family enzyme
MERQTSKLRALLKKKKFVYMPAVYYPLGGRLIEDLGFDAAYIGGYVTGGSRAVSEPLLTMTEQVETAEAVARSIAVPTVCDAGAGFGEPLHVTRTVREFILAGVAGIHIEDQLYPKRAHYHKYVAHAIPAEEFVDKIRWACRERDKVDKDFVIIARSDTCRFEGLKEAVKRINMGAEEGADYGMLFPRNHEEAVQAPKESQIPLVYVQSRGNRDGRPVYGLRELEEMGYAMCIDAQIYLLVSFHYARRALEEIRETGDYAGMSHEDNAAARQAIEDLIGLEDFYAIEEATVEERNWGKR